MTIMAAMLSKNRFLCNGLRCFRKQFQAVLLEPGIWNISKLDYIQTLDNTAKKKPNYVLFTTGVPTSGD